ncbi:MAG: hypothetical protein VCC99_11605 [Alphaproteobacteria bacterium]
MRRGWGCTALAALLAGLLTGGVTAYAQVAHPVDDGPSLDSGAVTHEINTEKVRIVMWADRAAVPVVDNVKIVIVVEAPPWFLISFPRIVDEMGPFKVLKQERAGPFVVAGSDRIERNERRYVLDPRVPGAQSIPPLKISVLDGSKIPSIACVYLHECRLEESADGSENSTYFLRTKRLEIDVTSVLPADADVTQPKDIAPPVNLPPPPPSELPWHLIAGIAAAVAATIALAFAVVWLIRREPPPKPVPMGLAHELALTALSKLEGVAVDSPDQVDAFYVRLSRILRHYLDWRFDLHGGERTTEEILAAAPERGDLLGRFLVQCDRVKFARFLPASGDSNAMLRTAVSFVKDTADVGKRVPLARAGDVA